METTSIQKFIHTSPRKLRLVADMARKQNPNKAMVTLRFTNKAAAKELESAISTALANAKVKGLNEELVNFKSIEINEGPRMKRFRAGARGRAKPYKRRMAHIKIVLSDDLNLKSQNSNVKTKTNNSKVEEKEVINDEVKLETKNSEKEVVVDNSAAKSKSKKKGRTELSKK